MFIAIANSVNGSTGTGTGAGGGGDAPRTAPVFQYKLRPEDRVPKTTRFVFQSLSTFPFEVYIGDDTYVINSSADTIDVNVTDPNPTDVSLSVGAEVKLSWARGGSFGINNVLRLDNFKVGTVEFIYYEDRDFSGISTLPFEILSDLTSCFSGATGLPSNIGLWKVNGVTLFNKMFAGVPESVMSDTFGQWQFGDGADLGASSFPNLSDADLASCLVQWEANANQGINVDAAGLPFGSDPRGAGAIRDLDETVYPNAKTAYDNLIANSNWDFGTSINWFAPVPPLLDTYPNAAAAYSVRLLRTGYVDSAMRVRRAVAPFDEQDIGFTADGSLDEAAIVAFGSGDELLVSAWYDQSGQSRHATQVTPGSQPQIYNGTAVLTLNGKPSINQRTDNYNGTFTLTGLTSSTLTVIQVVDTSDSAGGSSTNTGRALSSGSVVAAFRAQMFLFQGIALFAATSKPSAQTLGMWFFKATDEGYQNGTQVITGNAGTSAPSSVQTILGQSTNIRVCVATQELIIYESDQTSNRTGIETNIDDYYQIPGM